MLSQALTVEILRECFRNLQAWHSLYEAEGIDLLTSDGEEWSMWDMDTLYEMSQYYLSVRQRQAIKLCLYENLSEIQAARSMGTDEANPVTMYASSGLETLVHLYRVGMLPSVKEFRREQAKASLRSKAPIPASTGWMYDWNEDMADIIEQTYSKSPVGPVVISAPHPDVQLTVMNGTPVSPVPVDEETFYYQAEAWADYLDNQFSNGGNHADSTAPAFQ
jgi:hypothetical protein